jgi:DNA-binding Lrp family transcriptional regulator
MGRHGPRELILEVLVAKGPLNCRELEAGTGLSRKQVYNAVNRAWRSGVVLRTEEPVRRSERVLRGRAGASRNVRQFHRYMFRPGDVSEASVDGSR